MPAAVIAAMSPTIADIDIDAAAIGPGIISGAIAVITISAIRRRFIINRASRASEKEREQREFG